MNESMISKLPDADMQGAPAALLRAATRAREIALKTHTDLIILRNGIVVREKVKSINQDAVQTLLP
ncbi:MAG: hypothetical protein A3H35_14010 [Betaproteobacteria bacterium RIFCSPLOWO2_02_FULL_62_17]|nr:MAG: hypothetical protein A3H35_14010 [Betaproteobacteria bacterium RIFCSPLOWO2_02_FULL_62_17]